MAARQPAWWTSGVIALTLLAVLDVGLRQWQPWPARLPENFSAAYFERVVDDAGAKDARVLIVGDSAIWGYHLYTNESLGSRLALLLPSERVLNLSIQGGSPVNTYVAISEALRRGLRPRLVVFNLNLKEFDPEDRSYDRILPAFAPAARRLSSTDQKSFIYQAGGETRTARFVERFWALYRYRVDIRQSVFGDADFASRIASFASTLTGRTAREDALNAPTPDKYLGAYDLTPLGSDNISLQYTRETLRLLKDRGITAVVYLTPTNHGLLHDTIDVPEYDANLRALGRVARSYGARLYNLDRAFPQKAFIDNDHLDAAATAALAQNVATMIEASLR